MLGNQATSPWLKLKSRRAAAAEARRRPGKKAGRERPSFETNDTSCQSWISSQSGTMMDSCAIADIMRTVLWGLSRLNPTRGTRSIWNFCSGKRSTARRRRRRDCQLSRRFSWDHSPKIFYEDLLRNVWYFHVRRSILGLLGDRYRVSVWS